MTPLPHTPEQWGALAVGALFVIVILELRRRADQALRHLAKRRHCIEQGRAGPDAPRAGKV